MVGAVFADCRIMSSAISGFMNLILLICVFIHFVKLFKFLSLDFKCKERMQVRILMNKSIYVSFQQKIFNLLNVLLHWKSTDKNYKSKSSI